MQFLKDFFSLFLSPQKESRKRKTAAERLIIRTESGIIYKFSFTIESEPKE
jgi:hypothetical protein